MTQKDFRTYQRRSVTRESGYHTCEEATGGECRIVRAKRHICNQSNTTFVFCRPMINMVELFDKGISILAFGGYIYATDKTTISLSISYTYEGKEYTVEKDCLKTIDANNWTNIGIHCEQIINMQTQLFNVTVRMTVTGAPNNILDFVAFDLDTISKEEFLDSSCETSFYQKTNMHIPYLYYLRTDLPIDCYLTSEQSIIDGRSIVLKSCNRCGRYLPINIADELKTLSFSLHCKKKAPCVHSTFRAYKIEDITNLNLYELNLKIEDDKVVSHYGHQLECKACKKFFVNAPLNPQRNTQQHREDSLRRRAIEVLVNHLLETNLIHFEFERRTKKEFSQYIWKKFDKRCFKCGPDSDPIALKDMALDHTMPLAYLYRLDETATCLCSSHNSQKSDHFPVDYYSEEELIRLSSITGLPLSTLHTKEVNQQVLELLIANVVWFYDSFLMDPDYQKVRDGIKTADKINDSLKRIISGKVDLAEIYKSKTMHYPTSITIK